MLFRSDEFAEFDVVWADAVERAQAPHEDEIQAVVAVRLFDRKLVGRGFNDAQQAAVALGRGAGVAQLGFGKVLHSAQWRMRSMALASAPESWAAPSRSCLPGQKVMPMQPWVALAPANKSAKVRPSICPG